MALAACQALRSANANFALHSVWARGYSAPWPERPQVEISISRALWDDDSGEMGSRNGASTGEALPAALPVD